MNRTAIKQAALVALLGAPKRARAETKSANTGIPQRQRTQRRKTMNKTLAGMLCLTLVGAAGCAARTPMLDERFGDAVRNARVQQTINPDAGKNTDPVLGLDGLAARESIERYKDATKAPPPVMNVINIGGGVGGGQ